MADIKDFLNPTSMLTPGVAGGLTVSISMPLVIHFDMSFKWVALVVSLLFSLIIVLSFAEIKSKLLRGLYCVLNTLIIFSVSVGAGVTVDPLPKPPNLVAINGSNITLESSNSFSFSNLAKFLCVSSAMADPPEISLPNNATFPDTEEARPTSIAESLSTEGITTEPNDNHQLSLEEQIKKLEAEKKEAEERARKDEEIRKAQEQIFIEYEQRLQKYDKRWSW